ncbi:hypothetical protein [Trinickia acidisoli]|uniref:hypothetical protein n=1 Tax=Trinickia acidisoli TaxID=2767482 RepID=UPI001A901B52|nr:hypothetical protein [Trinickia acidisoli]
MNHALHFLSPAKARPRADERARARRLTHRDLPALLDLEHEKWNDVQAASQEQLRERIDTHPDLAIGAFCAQSGRLLASLFLRPVADDFHRSAHTWEDCTLLPAPRTTSTLFGISLTSRDQAGVLALFEFIWPYALKRGWRHIYLGSPLPGLRDWMDAHPKGRVENYVYAQRRGLPIDPQLRYYGSRGFAKIVSIKRNYFPHERSLDYGVLLRRTVPLSVFGPLWAAVSLATVKRVTRPLIALL